MWNRGKDGDYFKVLPIVIFYLGTNLLDMSEEQFWKSTPRKLTGLFKIYKKVNGIEEKEDFDYIDNIIF